MLENIKMMNIAPQLIFNGLIAGAIYALVAAGFSLIFSTCKFVHFAHGGVITLSAYIFYGLFSMAGVNFYLAVVLTILSAVILGFLLNRFVYRPLRQKKASSSILLIASVALLILLESLSLLFFGADVKPIKFLQSDQGIILAGAVITPLQIIIIITSLTLFGLLYIFMNKSKLGKATRAVADNKDVAEIVGISAEKIYSWSFMIGSAIAGVAAILVAMEQNLEPTTGTNLMVKGFTGAVIGGIGNVPGAILGAFLLGLVENFGIWWLPSGYKDAIAFGLLFIFLLFRSQGILGIKREIK